MLSRSEALAAVKETEFDIVIIGGGIVGAGIAQDAASRGLKAVVVEKDDFSSGTSSKTTKLIHGGLRYLEQFHFRLTRELCHERALLEQLAPHLVKDFSFILPIVEKDRFFAMKARAGLTLYDILAGQLASIKRHEKLSRQVVLEMAPSLSQDLIRGGLKFHDCITDDSRLVIEVLKSAAEMGALCVNYLKATGIKLANGLVSAVECHDRYSGTDITIATRSCVNAAGVWSDQVARMTDPSWKSHVVPAKGVHIMVPQSAFETASALFLPTRDHRYVFVVPWQKALMIGTTDTSFKGDVDNALPEPEEVDYLLGVVNEYAGRRVLDREHVIAAWAGLRPLVGASDSSMIREASGHEESTTSTLSREHHLFDGPANMVGLIGGKLTNYRILAGHVVDRILTSIPGGNAAGQSETGTTMLGGWGSKQGYLTTSAEISARARKLGIEPATLDHLIGSYGASALDILDAVERDSYLNKRICPDFPPIMAEVLHVVKNEMAVSLEDILFRRIRLGLVHQEQTLEAAEKVARLVQGITGWDDQRTQMEVEAVRRTLTGHMVFSERAQVGETV
ncbi:MAG: glycerol-3-phosphate dehydrogenase/oxidase [Candidatus Melainabacteria bacterium]|nr:glycerol-3-phosphate dehydrogenase/oxidase [Candidatus Melainabacteria bacterium]